MSNTSEAIEIKAKTVADAIEKGLRQLDLTEDAVDIEVLSQGSRGVLGIGAEEARVRLKPRVQPAIASTQNHELAQKEIPVYESSQKLTTPESSASEQTTTAEAGDLISTSVSILTDVLKLMDIDAEVKGELQQDDRSSEPTIALDIVGNDLGILIGRRGETLNALQYLTRLMVNHREHRWVNIIVDVEEYKNRRERTLRQVAERTAERVIATGRPAILEPMPPRERRIIHMTLRDNPHVTTESVGEGERRKVSILLKTPSKSN